MNHLIKIYNLKFSGNAYFKPFHLDPYTFKSIVEPSGIRIYNPGKDWREMQITATASVKGKKRNPIIFKNAKLIDRVSGKEYDLPLIEDLLLVMSLCLGRNVVPEYRSNTDEWPTTAKNHLREL